MDKIRQQKIGLYDPKNEHDACGIGFVANIKGVGSHSIVNDGLEMLENLEHRGAVGSDKSVGDGAGILTQIPDDYFREVLRKSKMKLPPLGNYGVAMLFFPKEKSLNLKAKKNFIDMQPGDVSKTFSDTDLFENWVKKSKDFLNQLDVTSLHKKAAKIINRFAIRKRDES